MKISIAAAILILASVGGGFASTPDTGAQPWDPVEDGPLPTAVSTTHKCAVREIDPATRTLVVFDEGTESLQRLVIDHKLPIKAESKKQFEGRRKLAFEDFAVGQRLKVTVLTKDGKVARIKVLKG